MQDYHAVTQQLTDKKSEQQEQLQTNHSVLSPLQIVRRRQLAEQIAAALTEEIEELRSRQAMILRNLDCKNNGEAQRFGSYLDKLEEMQEKLAAQRESLAQQLSATKNSTLELRIRFSRRLLMLFINSVLPCGQSSPSNEYRRYTVNAVLMIRQFRLRKNRRYRNRECLQHP